MQSLKETVIDIPEQSAVFPNNVTLQIDEVLFLQILDPLKVAPASLVIHEMISCVSGVEDPEYAVTQLAQTTMRSELGKLTMDEVFRERMSLNSSILHASTRHQMSGESTACVMKSKIKTEVLKNQRRCRWRLSAGRQPPCWSLRGHGRRPSTSQRVASKPKSSIRRERRPSR